MSFLKGNVDEILMKDSPCSMSDILFNRAQSAAYVQQGKFYCSCGWEIFLFWLISGSVSIPDFPLLGQCGLWDWCRKFQSLSSLPQCLVMGNSSDFEHRWIPWQNTGISLRTGYCMHLNLPNSNCYGLLRYYAISKLKLFILIIIWVSENSTLKYNYLVNHNLSFYFTPTSHVAL